MAKKSGRSQTKCLFSFFFFIIIIPFCENMLQSPHGGVITVFLLTEELQ